MNPEVTQSCLENYWGCWYAVEEWRLRHNAANGAIAGTMMNMYNPFLDPYSQDMSFVPSMDYPGYYYFYDDDVSDDKTGTMEEECDVNNSYNGDESNSSELEFVVNDEMIAFFEQSMRHKLELKKQRELLNSSDKVLQRKKNKSSKHEEESSQGEYEVALEGEIPMSNVKTNEEKRFNEMMLLYGEESPKICGMETALQLSFNRLCDRHKPVYWPVIPFRA